MISLESITLQNFLSWGDYSTTVALTDRGQCFVAGEIEESEAGVDRSNGAGKSSFTQAILWCLSGKTMYKKNPGNGVLNQFTENDCSVSLRFKDGSELTRIRRRDGNTELLYSKDDKRLIDCTLSTTSNQQEQLDQELGFDYDIFCGSVFFNQFSHPWMEMGDQTRKQTMERIMGVDRLSTYAELAKKKRDRIEVEQTKLQATIDGLQLVADSLTEQITTTQDLSEKFGSNQATRAQTKLDEAAEYQQQIDQFESIDVDKLVERWAIIRTIQARIKTMRERSRDLSQQVEDLETQEDEQEEVLQAKDKEIQDKYDGIISAVEKDTQSQIENKESKHKATDQDLRQKQSKAQGSVLGCIHALKQIRSAIQLWRDKEGRICSECEQEVPETHTASKIEPKLAEEQNLSQQKLDDQAEYTRLEEELEQLGREHKEALATLEDQRDTQIKIFYDKSDADIAALHQKAAVADLAPRIEKLKAQKLELDDKVDNAEERLTNSTPDKTVKEAEAENAKQDLLVQQAERARQEAATIKREPNPHLDTIADLEGKVGAKQEELDRVNQELGRYNLVYAHLHYIYRAYGERRKIKSFMIGKHQPYFNTRLTHYLDSFGLDVKIQLTNSLGLESNLWGYDFQSGGERARTNLAFLFAVFDLHSGIHGRQCNVLVLDEPDHHLDEAGRSTLIDIINDDLASRFESIFIISHNNAFKDVFPSQLTVRRIDRLSYLDETR